MSEPRKLLFPVLKRAPELPDCFVPPHVEAVAIVFPQRGEPGGVRPAPRPKAAPPASTPPAPEPMAASPTPDDAFTPEDDALPPDLVPEMSLPTFDEEPSRSGVVLMPPEPPAAPRAPTPPPPPPRIPPELEAAMRDAVHGLATARTQLLAEVEDELVGLAVEIARALLGEELSARPDLHRALVRNALTLLGPGETPRVRLSREAHDALVDAFGSSRIEVDGQRLDVIADPTLHGPGAVLDSGASRVDGLVETRLAEVRRALLEARRASDEHAA